MESEMQIVDDSEIFNIQFEQHGTAQATFSTDEQSGRQQRAGGSDRQPGRHLAPVAEGSAGERAPGIGDERVHERTSDPTRHLSASH
ncbi:hypothetical protein KTAU_07650 [Thermogemmatispora aurantia]|uniref:Uncharacterized protein n=1 Tax=Thermogemmatispora aurantia TaxID=2045279 RepID=A0A5J4K614_9CHLR|nr:hypothetical protein KTAU_07650 [Thermogemmatispora aurantia]